MKPTDFWKNFALGTELDIAGTFIFNGLRRFHEMESLYYEAEVFEVLYNLAVGIERLLKIAVILIEHDDAVDQQQFEESLITHSHQDLVRRVRAKHDLKLSPTHNEFLDLMGTFYKTHRYGRYAIASAGKAHSEKRMLHRYIEKWLNIKIEDTFPLQITPNDKHIRSCIGKRVGYLTKALYRVIEQEASRLNIYTYELRTDSKAEKIFIRERFDFCDEDVLWKELLLFFINSEHHNGIIDYMKSLKPLAFDPGLTTEYLQSFASEEKKLSVLDELETLYEDLDNVGQRFAELELIGNPLVFFDSDDSEEHEDEE